MKEMFNKLAQKVKDFAKRASDYFLKSGGFWPTEYSKSADRTLFRLAETGDLNLSEFRQNLEILLVNGATQTGLTEALTMASVSDQTDTMKMLMEYGADSDAVYRSFVNFHDRISKPAAEILLEGGNAFVDISEKHQKRLEKMRERVQNAPRVSSFQRKYNVMDVHAKGEELCKAITSGNYGLVQINMMYSDYSNNTAWLDSALAFTVDYLKNNSETDVVSLYRHQLLPLLVERGANVDHMNGYALRNMVEADEFDAVRVLLDMGAKLPEDQEKNVFIFHNCVFSGQIDLLPRVMPPTADGMIDPDYAVKSLELAMLSGRQDVVDFIFDRSQNKFMSREQAHDCLAFTQHNFEQIKRVVSETQGQKSIFDCYLDYMQQCIAEAQQRKAQAANENESQNQNNTNNKEQKAMPATPVKPAPPKPPQ